MDNDDKIGDAHKAVAAVEYHNAFHSSVERHSLNNLSVRTLLTGGIIGLGAAAGAPLDKSADAIVGLGAGLGVAAMTRRNREDARRLKKKMHEAGVTISHDGHYNLTPKKQLVPPADVYENWEARVAKAGLGRNEEVRYTEAAAVIADHHAASRNRRSGAALKSVALGTMLSGMGVMHMGQDSASDIAPYSDPAGLLLIAAGVGMGAGSRRKPLISTLAMAERFDELGVQSPPPFSGNPYKVYGDRDSTLRFLPPAGKDKSWTIFVNNPDDKAKPTQTRG